MTLLSRSLFLGLKPASRGSEPLTRRDVASDTTNEFATPNIAIQVLIILLSTSFISLKCIVRRVCLRIWTTEDYLMVISWALLIIYISFNTYLVEHGGGRHNSTLAPADKQEVKRWINYSTIVYSVAMAFSRSAVLVTYMNIFTVKPGPTVSSRSSHRRSVDYWFIIVMITVNALFFTCSMFLKIFVCTPRQKIWDPSTPGTCIDIGSLIIASSIWNTVADLVVLALPILFLRRMKLGTRTKWQIIGIFTLGAIAYPAFSIAGLIFRAKYAFNEDSTFWLPRIQVFIEAEIAAGLICACVPSVTYLLKRLRTRQSSYRSHNGAGDRQDNSYRRYSNRYWHLDPSRATPDINNTSRHSPDPTLLAPSATAIVTAGKNGESNSVDGPRQYSEVSSDERSLNGTWIELDNSPGTQSQEPKIWKTTEISVKYNQKPRK